MTDFLEYQTVLVHRCPVNSDGTLGKPQLIKMFSRAIKETKTSKVVKSVPQELSASQSEDVEL